MSVIVKPSDVVFKRYEIKVPSKLNLSVDALDKGGKSHFALTAPGPVGYQDLDDGLHRVADKFPEKEIYRFGYTFPETLRLPGTEINSLADAAGKIWNEFVINSRAAVTRCRTLVVDTGSKTWELLRLARLGKLTQVMPIQYTAINQEFTELVKLLHTSNANIIWLHRLKPVYENDKKVEGRYERAGFGEMGFEVDAVIRLSYDDSGKFLCRIGNCGPNRGLQGKVIEGMENITFPKIAQLIYPSTSEEHWQ